VPLTDLPLREEPPASASLSRDAAIGPERERPVRQPGGVVIWLAAAASLVAGILIGFMTGYTSGRRAVAANPGQTFSEAAVVEPVRVDPPPVVIPEEPAVTPEAPVPEPVRSDRSTRSNVSNASNESNERGPGSIEVLSRPAGAQVILDGRTIGRTPLSIPDVAAGGHSVRVELPGFNRWATSIDVTPGARTRVAASLEQP